jgi:hypothetical protein
MGSDRPKNSSEATALQRTAGGDQPTVQEMLAPHRDRLKGMVHLSLAAHLLGRLTTPSQAVVKAEARLIVQSALINQGGHRQRLSARHQTAQGDSVADT